MDITLADLEYLRILQKLHHYYTKKRNTNEGRNAITTRLDLAQCKVILKEFPVVTVKKTAIKKALTELEWFLSGNNKCPENLLDWWEGQLNPQGRYIGGYTDMLSGKYNQVHERIKSIRSNPNSRRHIITTWDPLTCDNITVLNENPKTPTPCHLSFVQFICEGNRMDMLSYQRSGDILLGVPHNWVQHWALLTYICAHTGHKPRNLIWEGGDIHLYNEKSHIEAIEQILFFSNNMNKKSYIPCTLQYNPPAEYDLTTDIVPFRAEDFSYNKVSSPPYQLPKIKMI